jgi:hypothetical protein
MFSDNVEDIEEVEASNVLEEIKKILTEDVWELNIANVRILILLIVIST